MNPTTTPPLFWIARQIDVVGAKRGVGGDDDADRAIDAGELLNGNYVLDVAVTGTAVFVGKDAAHKAEFP